LEHDAGLKSENKLEAKFENNLIAGPALKYKENAWESALAMV
jgi:hypothetical protein